MSPITFNIKNPEQKSIEEFYKSEIEHFPWFDDEKLFFQDPLNKFRMSRIKEEVLRLKPSSILDVGCGNAMLIKSILSDNSYKPQFVAGIDISLKGLRAVGSGQCSVLSGQWPVDKPSTIHHQPLANRPTDQLDQSDQQTNRPFFICSNAANLPFQSNTFDCVVCTETLEHIFNLSDVLSEINRVLKPSGKLIVTVPNLFCFDSIEGEFGIITKILQAVNLLRRITKIGTKAQRHLSACVHAQAGKGTEEIMNDELRIMNENSNNRCRGAQFGRFYNRKLPNHQITKLPNHLQPSAISHQPLFEYGINTHLHKMLPKRWKKTIKKSKFKIIKEFPIYIFPYLPYFFEGLKNLEAKIFQNKNFKQLFQNYEQILSKVLFFRFVGQLHCFVASKY